MDKALATQLVKQKERFEALFEYASMGILVADDKGAIQMANNYLLNQFGYNKNELLQQPVEVLIPARYEQVHHQHREQYNKHPEPRSMGVGRDLFARKKDGSEFPVEVSLSNYSMDDRKYIIAFVIDITARKQIEYSIISQKEQLAENNLKIEEMNQELEQKVALRTQQLQEAMREVENSRDELKKALSKEKELGDLKTRFVSMASHEFRTPLSTILSSASLLAKYQETSEQEKRNKHITRIKSSVNNLTDILNEFLSIGKIEDGRIIPRYAVFNVKSYIQNICAEMKAVAKKHQQLKYTHTGAEVIHSDESLLRNIIFNLLSNAIKFTSENGFIFITSIVENRQFVINIKDNGIGISEDDKQHLFERFFRASNATNIQGTGLGLHIVSKYVEMMEGTISFESELEKGSSVTITFNNPQ